MNYYVRFDENNIPINWCITEYFLIEGELKKVSKEEYYALRKSCGIIDIIEPTTNERIADLETENKTLHAQINALTATTDFQEELIVEMATEVYK